MAIPSQARRGATGYLPINVKIADRPVLVVGGGRSAFSELRRLVEFGALVDVVAPHVVSEITDISVTHSHRLQLKKRAFSIEDEDAIANRAYSLVFICTGTADLDEYISKLCTQSGLFFCLPDNHELESDANFVMPAIRKRGHIKISVSTDGFSHALARSLLERVESSLGTRLDKYMVAVDSFKEKLSALYDGDTFSEVDRKHILRKLAESEELILAFQRENFEEALQLADMVIAEIKDAAPQAP